MKKLSVAFILLLTSILAIAQEEKGIRFEDELSWQQVLGKAKTENKFVFVDCFATWCGPCKLMDKEVYPKESVGNYINEKFISVKAQMDTSKQDNGQVKNWYASARDLRQQYKVTAFPTYLFFTPEGKIVHRGVGAVRDSDFLRLSANALNPAKQYYTLLENYRQGNKDYPGMAYLVTKSKSIGDNETANAIARDYLDNYLYKLSEDELPTKDNIEFIRSSAKTSKEKWFDMFYRKGKKIDVMMGMADYAQGFVDYIITLEEIDPRLWRNLNYKEPITDKPNWKKIGSAVRKKYDAEYADRVVLNAKLRWYGSRKEWPVYCENVIIKVKKYGPYGPFSTDFKWNANAWDLFLHSADKVALTKALEWSDSAIRISPKPNAEYFDTYANLLYKLGRTQDAIALQEKAIALDPKAKDIQQNLDKMRKGEPTWPKQEEEKK